MEPALDKEYPDVFITDREDHDDPYYDNVIEPEIREEINRSWETEQSNRD